MPELSPHYRNDDPRIVDPATKAYLDEHYLGNLKNLDVPNPKLLVVFSGGNAVGKSTLAAKIQERFGAVVLENDELKRWIKQVEPDIDRDKLNPLVWQYTMQLYEKLGSLSKNGLIVRDGVIDWYYDRILPVFLNQGYELFIIAFDLSDEKLHELIKARGDTPTLLESRAYELLEDHEIHQKRFRALYAADVTYTDDTLFDSDLVLNALAERLEGMS
jgi:predicted kinase